MPDSKYVEQIFSRKVFSESHFKNALVCPNRDDIPAAKITTEYFELIDNF